MIIVSAIILSVETNCFFFFYY